MNPSPHIVVATPCYGGLVTQGYMMSVLRLTQYAATAGLSVKVLVLGGDALIGRARASLVAHVLADPASTHLLFVDADIAFEVDQFRRLFDADRDFVAGLYPLKATAWAQVPARVVAGEPLDRAGLSYVGQPCAPPELRVEGGFATGTYAGTGFQLIKRGVFERMIAAYPALKFRSLHGGPQGVPPQDHLYALFDCIIDQATGTYLSEDYAFCRRWRDIGGTIWLDLESRLTHTGTENFSGDCAQRFAPLRGAGAPSWPAAA